MAGGIKAWDGMMATGPFEIGMAFFAPAVDIRQITGLAWTMEEGSRRFYQEAGKEMQSTPEAAQLFWKLVEAEEGHKRKLLASYEHLTGRSADPTSWVKELGIGGEEAIMEGGVPVREVLSWLQGRELAEVIELAMGLEINAYDLYIKMGRKVKSEAARQIFALLAREEQQHLELLGQVLDGCLEITI